jgi:hypothetical protein
MAQWWTGVRGEAGMRERGQTPRAPDRAGRAENPYRAYQPRRVAPAFTTARAAAPVRRRGLARFHDGNAGHFWRGEVASLLGEVIIYTGALIWLAYLGAAPTQIGLALALIGTPYILFGPLATPLENVREPGPWLRRIGYLRVLCALGFVAMHYLTLFPVIFLLLFGVSFFGRLRAALRVAATRVCLAPGEFELVANDLHVGAALVATFGPLLAALLFLLLAERILAVSIVATVAFLLSANSDGFLDALPRSRRAFLRATIEEAVPDEREREQLLLASQPEGKSRLEDDSEDELAEALERALPEWYQPGPRSPVGAIGAVRAGLGLAGGTGSSRTSLLTQAALALVGGGFAVLEIFYVLYILLAPIFVLGVLLAAEAGGMALGAVLAPRRDAWRMGVVIGMLGTGVGLVTLATLQTLAVAIGACFLLGLMNALAVTGARRGLRAGFNGREQRALTAGEGFVTALCGVVGIGLFLFFYLGPAALPGIALALLSGLHFPGEWWTLGEVFLGTGVVMIVAGLIFAALLLVAGNGVVRKKGTGVTPLTTRSHAIEAYGASASFPVADEWDDDEMGYSSRHTSYERYDEDDDDGRPRGLMRRQR